MDYGRDGHRRSRTGGTPILRQDHSWPITHHAAPPSWRPASVPVFLRVHSVHCVHCVHMSIKLDGLRQSLARVMSLAPGPLAN